MVVVILVLLLSLWKKTPLVFFVCDEKAKRYIYISVATMKSLTLRLCSSSSSTFAPLSSQTLNIPKNPKHAKKTLNTQIGKKKGTSGSHCFLFTSSLLYSRERLPDGTFVVSQKKDTQ